MDPPVGAGAGDTQDKKAEVFRAMPPADPQHCVRGQYQGYADVPGVASGSATETFVALRLEIDNWRWADVPSSCGPARRYRTRSPRCGCSCAARPGWPSSRSRPGQSLTRSSCGSTRTRTRACGCSCPLWADSPGARSTWTPLSPASSAREFRPRARRAAGAIRGAAACRDGRRPPVLCPGGQRRGDLGHRAAAARPPAPRPSLPARVLGTRGGGNPLRGHPRWQQPWLPEEG
jgi:hypothetical protein